MSTPKEHEVVDEVSTSNKKLAYNVHKGPKVTKLVRGPKDVTKVSARVLYHCHYFHAWGHLVHPLDLFG